MSNSPLSGTGVPDSRAFPGVSDQDGYLLDTSDFDFLGIDEVAAWACHHRTSPLGVESASYQFFLEELGEALDRERLNDADVRIQGSSVNFFSSPLKSFPTSRSDIARMFKDEHGRIPQAQELAGIEERIANQWAELCPTQRPFDSMYLLGISPDRSDIDVQISSYAAFSIVRAIAAARGIDPDGMRIENPSYCFLDRSISDVEFLYLRRWVARWEAILDRGVAIALFDGDGPPQSAGLVSSHFKESDWKADAPMGRIDASGGAR